MTDEMKLTRLARYPVPGAAALLALASTALSARRRVVTGVNVVGAHRLPRRALPLAQLGSCLKTKPLKMPDIGIVAALTTSFAGNSVHHDMFASLVIAETFTRPQFRLRLKAAGGRRCAAGCGPLQQVAASPRSRARPGCSSGVYNNCCRSK
jgi:hypothetical protein